jgi:hypothetical protein
MTACERLSKKSLRVGGANPSRSPFDKGGQRGISSFPAAAAILLSIIFASPTWAGIDLVTLPERDSVQLTIYNSADLTLAREVRKLTLRKGINRLSFGWANTLIDPTSLNLRAIQRPDAVHLLDISYPPRINSQGIWTVESQVDGEVPVEITFFTSGITWRAFYMATLAPDERSIRLQGYVRVENHSGEDYQNAQTRLIVGKIHLLDQIAELARRTAPYGMPMEPLGKAAVVAEQRALMRKADAALEAAAAPPAPSKPKEIIKEGLSEYFLYTIEGTETIPNEWAKRLPSFEAKDVPVVNLYKFEEERYGKDVMRFLLFANDKLHKLGDTPLPDGLIKVFRQVDGDGHLSYEGADSTKYIPVEQKVELNLGPMRKVAVEPKMMKTRTENFSFNRDRNIDGWEEVQDWTVEARNNREVPARVEIKRNLRHQYWDLKPGMEDHGQFEREDMDTVKFTLELKPYERRQFTYTVRYFEGERRNRR